MKYECNMKKVNEGLLSTPYSKNYRKVQEKLRITNMKIHNIRKNWILQTCSKIAKEYDTISVDTFNQPNNGYSYTSKIKKMNYYNRNHAMYDFNETLKYLSHKYYCTYISSPEYSTRTCSNCGYINVKLDLSKRYLKCKKCGIIIDRDINASKNCFDYIQ